MFVRARVTQDRCSYVHDYNTIYYVQCTYYIVLTRYNLALQLHCVIFVAGS